MSKTLIVGDLHLGRGQNLGKPGVGTFLNGRIIDQLNLLDWVLDQAIEHNVTMIILTGDIFHDIRPDYNLMRQFIDWIGRCANALVEIHIVAGNHDIRRSGYIFVSCLDILEDIPNVTFYKNSTTIYNETVAFTLLPFRDRKSMGADNASKAIERLRQILTYERQDIPETYNHVVVGHLALEGSIPVGDELDESNELMCPLDMFNGYNFVWMGHIHRPQERSPLCAHVGSLDRNDFGEAEDTKNIVLFDSDGSYQYIIVPTRQLRSLNLIIDTNNSINATQIVLDRINSMNQEKPLSNCILRIQIQLQGPSISIDRNIVTQAVSSYNIHYLCGFTETRTTCVVPQEKRKDINHTIDPKSAVLMWANEHIDQDKDAFIQLCNNIIDGV